MKTRSPRSPVV
ncbi:putative Mannosyl-oligosaccharide glucosidase protein, partial [Naja naja]